MPLSTLCFVELLIYVQKNNVVVISSAGFFCVKLLVVTFVICKKVNLLLEFTPDLLSCSFSLLVTLAVLVMLLCVLCCAIIQLISM
jgi:hypothetical protein